MAVTTVRSGILLPFEVSYVEGLSVGMKIYDTTDGGTPALVATVLMTHVINGTYVGYYTLLAEHTYVVNISVYTDSLLTTLDSGYYPSSATYDTFPAVSEDSDAPIEPVILPPSPGSQWPTERLLGFPQLLRLIVIYQGRLP